MKGILYVGFLFMTYGTLDQNSMHGPYSGVQCTSMATAAIVFFARMTGKKWIIQQDDIDDIIREGHDLHTYFRENLTLSRNEDMKIAVEDIPYDTHVAVELFGQRTQIKLEEAGTYVYLDHSVQGGLLSLSQYIKNTSREGERCGFLLTVGVYTYALLAVEDGKVLLFDSHGHLRSNGKIIVNKAGVLALANLPKFVDFICSMYGANTPALIGKVSVTFPPVPTTEVGESCSLSLEATGVTCGTHEVTQDSVMSAETPSQVASTPGQEVAPPMADTYNGPRGYLAKLLRGKQGAPNKCSPLWGGREESDGREAQMQ